MVSESIYLWMLGGIGGFVNPAIQLFTPPIDEPLELPTRVASSSSWSIAVSSFFPFRACASIARRGI